MYERETELERVSELERASKLERVSEREREKERVSLYLLKWQPTWIRIGERG